MYKCVHCGAVYEDGSHQIISGCEGPGCRSKFFFYIKKEKLKEIEKEQVELSKTEKKQVEEDVREILGQEDEESPVFLDFESIKILKPGKYLLDISKLFESDRPQVYQLEDGKYVVDLSAVKSREE